MGSKLKTCGSCGGEYVEGLYRAHTSLGHEGRRRMRKRVVKCSYCKALYPRKERAEHLTSEVHLQRRREALDFVIPAAAAYVRGDDVEDICRALDIKPYQLYRAVRACNLPLRGNPTAAQRAIALRQQLVPKYGRRWSTVRKMREQGKSWHAIEQTLVG